MSNFKSAAKRKRELAKLDKRHAKDQKRAARRAERSAADVGAATPTSAIVSQPMLPAHGRSAGAPAVNKPTTLAEAVELWRSTKIVKPRSR
jgi:hypothetical protein